MIKRFDLQPCALEGLSIFQRVSVGDHRGYLERLFCDQELKPLLNGKTIRQINHTLTKEKGALRGMHFQYPPHAEIKFVSCIRGEVFDVAIDLRQGSKTFLDYHSEILSAENHKTMVVPEGFAHGFQALSDDCEMLYFMTHDYVPDAEGGLNAKDPALNISWPLAISDISKRDQGHSMISKDFKGITL